MLSLSAIAAVAEGKIREAMAEGVFDDLPGTGRPLKLDEDAHIPPEARLAYKILKNSGYISPVQNHDVSAGPANELSLAAEPARALKAAGDAAGRQCSRLRRFTVMLGRVRRVRRLRGESPDPALDLALAGAMGDSLENSPYFGKVLDKF